MLKINSAFIRNTNAINNNKKKSFGMNPIHQSKKMLDSSKVDITPELLRVYSNVQKNNLVTSSNLNSLHSDNNSSNIELIDVIIEQSQVSEEEAEAETEAATEAETETERLNRLYEEKDTKAELYFSKNVTSCTKISSCIPFIGIFFIDNLKRKRCKELDSIYNVPQFAKSSNIKTWPHTILNIIGFLHATFWGSIIATPLAICTVSCLDKIQKQNLKKVYKEMAEQEKRLQENETPEETTLRHAEMEADYWENISKSNIDTIRHALYY